ncbi:MAG: dTMP kinase [Acetobacteraceae bacterium]|nr:dTMP kinase [Acetobacteraceae bacterium]MCX7686096.1 dTMP kinase [Acetobacteraceae bacterium]MDW8398737.1 dTMP kinase [Acetobacteraceae bacterium]
MAARGAFITLEGGEGAGKTTQLRRLAERLRKAGREVVETREPGGTPSAERLRAVLLEGGPWEPVTQALLHFAARREHVTGLILPSLAAGRVVLSDRFADSTLAYQCHGLGLPRAVWDRLAEVTLEGLRPDLTLILDLPVERGLARAAARGGNNRYERLPEAFHARVRAGFRAIAAAEPRRCAVVDADADPETVAARVAAVVAERLPGLLP